MTLPLIQREPCKGCHGKGRKDGHAANCEGTGYTEYCQGCGREPLHCRCSCKVCGKDREMCLCEDETL